MRIIKILLIFVLVAALLGGAYFIYTYLFIGAPLPFAAPAGGEAQTGAAAETPALLKAISQQPVFDYWVNTKTNAIYLVTTAGKIFRTFGDGREEEVSKQALQGLHAVTGALDGMRALIHFGYPASEAFAVFTTETKSFDRLPAGTAMAAFDPTGQSIAYLQRNATGGMLNILSLADKKSKNVLPLAVADGEMFWRAAQEILVLPQPTARVVADALLIDLAKKTVRRVGMGAMTLWNASGDAGLRLLLSNGAPLSLALVTSSGVPQQTLPFLTIPSKCGFLNSTLYCGVPFEFPPRSILPDDYLKEKFFTQDGLIRYDAITGAATTLFSAGDALADIVWPVVKGKQLLFINRYDEKLYAFGL